MKNPFGLLLAILPFLSCSKGSGNSSGNNSSCQLVGITLASSNESVQISYNNNGQVEAIQSYTGDSVTNTQVYSYSGDKMVELTTGGGYTTTDSVTLNSSGYMLSDDEHTVWSSGSNSNTTEVTYAADGEVSQVVTSFSSGTVTQNTYHYTGGNLTSITSPGDTVTFTYYTDKPFQTGDYYQLNELLEEPAPIIKNVNLLATADVGGQTDNFSYTFDNTGKITSVTSTEGITVTVLNLQYQCN